jgi:hypothetical protein
MSLLPDVHADPTSGDREPPAAPAARRAPPPARGSSRLPLLVTVLLILLAELGVRALDPPPPLEWSSEEAQVKVEELAAVGRSGGGGTVFVGSSVADVALDPARFSAATGGAPAYNAALLGADLRSMELWVEHVVVPEAAPSRVVLALNCRELNGAEAAQDDFFREFASAPAMARLRAEERALDRFDRWVGEWSELVRYRSVVRTPRSLFDDDRRSGVNLELVEGGYNAAYRDRSYPEPDDLHEVLFPGDIARFEVGDDLVGALDRTLAHLQERGIDAVVVHMPVTEDWLSYLPDRGTFDECDRVMSTSAAAAGATFVEGRVLDRALFADPIHVNGAGSDQVTDYLAAELGPSR